MTDATDPGRRHSAGHHGGDRPVDPVTGHETTGHDWGGITELNTAFPRIVIWALVLAFSYSVIAWILLPAWPLGHDYTRGLLGLDQSEEAVREYREMERARADWLAPFASAEFAALASDAPLMARAMPAAARLFADNCAACHQAKGTGGPGFPNLVDADWLWGGDPEEIAETLRVGVNSTHPDTRVSQMLAFGRDGILPAGDIELLVDHVLALSRGEDAADGPGAELFAENCAACHGEGGVGGLGIGAPALNDGDWLYGGSPGQIRTTLRQGRQGVMPSWEGRLSPSEINLLALYVERLGKGNRNEARE
ncbi:cytochrome-c oxidase, cbb3-type subunit III [Frigidibacter sp. ROC022]|uniref:cytochrome-c oxidase, cbb3-type subunit III n=1 Tax=Frigidibacter sp. ROC022 TaxID=2971796 RepID=UPI00215B4885|nr:cytochrome-c oxidase, cbb3-type subunit III [Frigidibacter sp. ROC022]MCR8723892.1 cytochrome-c oxidase, cbb3-type subunit III [Frigidibacter sp. ROC022]